MREKEGKSNEGFAKIPPAMKFPWRMLRKIVLWSMVAVLVVVAGVGLMFFDQVVPRRHSVAFFFAGWTNDFAGARVAALCISNRSREPVTYWADRHRQPRCDLMVVASRHKQGRYEQIVYTNLTLRLWDGHMPLQLLPHAGVNCLLPWRDAHTNGQITVSYMPEPDVIQRMRERFGALLNRQPGRPWRTISLTGAPWTNAPAAP